MLQKVIAASLALIPFFCWLGWSDGVRTPKEAVSIIALLAIVGVSLFIGIKSFKNKWLLWFMGWCFISTLLAPPVSSFIDANIALRLPSSMVAMKSLFYILLSIVTIICLASAKLDLNKISRVINFVVIGLCVYGILQIFGLDEFFRVADRQTGWIAKSIWDVGSAGYSGSLSHRVVATLGNPAILSIFLSFCIPFTLFRLKQEGWIALILSIIILIFTRSATGILCSVVASVIYYFFVNKKVMIGIILLCILSGLIGNRVCSSYCKTMLNPKGRVEVLKESWDILHKKPLTGFGLGSFEYLIGEDPDIVKRLNGQQWKQMHNEYGQTWFETGLIGLVLFLLSIGSTIKRFVTNINFESITLFASFVAMMLAGMSYFILRISPLSIYAVIVYGLLEQKIGDVR